MLALQELFATHEINWDHISIFKSLEKPMDWKIGTYGVCLCRSDEIVASNLQEKESELTIKDLDDQDSDDDNNYITSSVDAKTVRWLESSGADSVVIQPWMTDKEIDEILTKINGVLFQSRSFNLAKHTDFVMVSEILFDKIIKLANVTDTNKITIPVLGIDNGLRILHYLVAEEEVSGNFISLNRSIPLEFNKDLIQNTKLFSLLNNQDLSNLASKNITFHNHQNGIEPEIYDNSQKLNKFFTISSLACLYASSLVAAVTVICAVSSIPYLLPTPVIKRSSSS
jgi:hypothetical protein